MPLTQSRLGGACALVPNFSRVYERPEGVELVLSEWGEDDREYNASHVPDPLYPLLVQNPSTCDVPVSASGPATYRVQSTATVGGYMGTIFELPPQGTPLPFGDHP